MEEPDDFTNQRARLATVLPRGRFTRAVDGTCIAVTRADPDGDIAHLFEVAPGRRVGLFYVGGPARYLHALLGLVVRHVEGDGEGVLHLAWTPELAARLRAFSRGLPRGVPFTPAVDAFLGPRSRERCAVGAGVPPAPLRASQSQQRAA
jgi:hypothetical protein